VESFLLKTSKPKLPKYGNEVKRSKVCAHFDSADPDKNLVIQFLNYYQHLFPEVSADSSTVDNFEKVTIGWAQYTSLDIYKALFALDDNNSRYGGASSAGCFVLFIRWRTLSTQWATC
jgi:hypothetical protein